MRNDALEELKNKVDQLQAELQQAQAELALARAAQYGAPTTIPAKNARIGDLDIRCGFCQGPGGESIEFFKEL